VVCGYQLVVPVIGNAPNGKVAGLRGNNLAHDRPKVGLAADTKGN
jgi:hypothetical protein